MTTTSVGPLPAAPVLPPRVPRPRPVWEAGYVAGLLVLDALAITLASALALLLRFGDGETDVVVSGEVPLLSLPYVLVVALITPVWVLVLAASRCYEARFLTVGSEEFKRVVNGSVRFAALLAFASYAFNADLSRLFVGLALPTGVVLLLVFRYLARKAVHALRHRGRCLHRVVAVGSIEEVEHLIRQIRREPYAGLKVVATALPDYEPRRVELDGAAVPDVGPPRDVAARLAELGANTLAVAGTSAVSTRELRKLSWDLEGSGVDLVVAPAITDVAGPRIHVRPVAGLPLLHVEEPAFGGLRQAVKATMDLLVSFVLVVLLLLPGLAIAAAIKLEDGGPVFYRQERVGRDGRLFRIWKFRSMRVGADRLLPELAQLNESEGPLFKIRKDPRVTRVGARLRKYSLDEIPQILNVLVGQMSLVGPRPPLAAEVAQYAEDVHRRLLVKPGMTGLWQVSGRSDLEWDEAVRLDLYYVENWSVTLDIMILWKTVFEVLRGRGAY